MSQRIVIIGCQELENMPGKSLVSLLKEKLQASIRAHRCRHVERLMS
jgi:hypothetical protein